MTFRASLVALLVGLPAVGCQPSTPGDEAPPLAPDAPLSETFDATDRQRMDTLAQSVTIHRDTWGVPHVFGPTDESVMFGAAYARAEDQLPEDELFFLDALGRRAELDGHTAFQSDLLNRAFRIPQLAQAEYASSPSKIRALVEAYADGVNYYLLQHPEVRWKVLTHFEPWYVFAAYRLDAGPWLAGPDEQIAFELPPPTRTDRMPGRSVHRARRRATPCCSPTPICASTCPTSSTSTATKGSTCQASPATAWSACRSSGATSGSGERSRSTIRMSSTSTRLPSTTRAIGSRIATATATGAPRNGQTASA